jgi:type IV pilus assembly protein PilZ
MSGPKEDLEHAAPNSADAERRGDDRAPITLKVDYKRLNSFFADYTKNISKGGTFIRTEKPLEIGTEFVFVLTLPEPTLEGAGVKLELAGIVKWVVTVEKASEEQPPGMGIQFVFEGDAQRLRVEQFVADLMHQSLGPALAEKLLAQSKADAGGAKK